MDETPNRRAQEFGRSKHQKLQKDTKLISTQKPRGHKEGMASIPNQFQYKNSRIHGSNPREGRWSRETGRERWRQAQGGMPFCFIQAQGREERGEGYLRYPRRGPKYPRLKLDTKTPVGAKPEICTRSHPTAEFFLRLEAISAMPPCR